MPHDPRNDIAVTARIIENRTGLVLQWHGCWVSSHIIFTEKAYWLLHWLYYNSPEISNHLPGEANPAGWWHVVYLKGLSIPVQEQADSPVVFFFTRMPMSADVTLFVIDHPSILNACCKPSAYFSATRSPLYKTTIALVCVVCSGSFLNEPFVKHIVEVFNSYRRSNTIRQSLSPMGHGIVSVLMFTGEGRSKCCLRRVSSFCSLIKCTTQSFSVDRFVCGHAPYGSSYGRIFQVNFIRSQG